jgi:hypothetical protein
VVLLTGGVYSLRRVRLIKRHVFRMLDVKNGKGFHLYIGDAYL